MSQAKTNRLDQKASSISAVCKNEPSEVSLAVCTVICMTVLQYGTFLKLIFRVHEIATQGF